MNNSAMEYHRVTTGESFDTSGAYSGDMVATSQVHSGVYRIEGGELTHTPHMQSDKIDAPPTGIEATAVKQSGWGKADLSDPNTLVTIGGVQAPVGFFEAMGLLERTPEGNVQETTPQQSKVEPSPVIQENPDEKVEAFHPEVEAEVQSFVKAMHPVALTDAMDQAVTAIVNGSGDVNIETLAKLSGKDVEKTYDQMAKVLVANKVRSEAIMENEGIPPADFQKAYEWAKTEAPQALHKAMGQLLKNRNGNGIRKLAQAYKQEMWLKDFQ